MLRKTGALRHVDADVAYTKIIEQVKLAHTEGYAVFVVMFRDSKVGDVRSGDSKVGDVRSIDIGLGAMSMTSKYAQPLREVVDRYLSTKGRLNNDKGTDNSNLVSADAAGDCKDGAAKLDMSSSNYGDDTDPVSLGDSD